MNDDFLHRIRAQPSADFLARLKTRLDRQVPPPPKPRRTALRALAWGLLFGGSAFAITLLTITGGRETGSYLVAHPGVDKVAFTGSTAAGRIIAAHGIQAVLAFSALLDHARVAQHAQVLRHGGEGDVGHGAGDVAGGALGAPDEAQDGLAAGSGYGV